MISAAFTGDAAALDRLRALPEAAVAGIARAVAQLGSELQANVRRDQLSGQVLRARSGALRDSISVRIDNSSATMRATVYSALGYAAAQEYGFSGTVGVRASLRRIKQAFGHPIAQETISVGPYERRMNLPQRSFLRSALDEMTAEIEAQIADAVREALRQ